MSSFALSSYVKDSEKELMLRSVADQQASSYVYSSDLLSVDEMLKLGFSVINETGGLLLIMKHPETKTCLLLSSGDTKCGELVREFAPKHNGKGGGRDDNARAVFSSSSDMDSFIKDVVG